MARDPYENELALVGYCTLAAFMLVLLFEFQLSSGGYSVSIYGTGTDYAALLVICGTTGNPVIVVL